MRLSGLSLAAILLISSAVWGQHSSGGGGGSSAGGASGGGAHGGGGGSSFSAGSSGGHSSGGSGGGHSSGGTVSHASSFRGTSGRGTNSIVSGREAAHDLRYPLHGLNLAAEVRPAPPEKRSFFSILRHPFHRPERKAAVEANILLPGCARGHCRPCQAGARNCSAPVIPVQSHRGCWSRGLWNGICQMQTQLFDGCSGLSWALHQQFERMQAAESAKNFCGGGATQGCSEATAAWNSQAGLYRALQARYRSCLAQHANVYPFGGHMIVGYGASLRFEPLSADVSY
jgi:hypothetical protein